jgi:uncharacterized protein
VSMLLDLRAMRGVRDRIVRSYDPAAFLEESAQYRVIAPVGLAFDIFKDRDQYRLAGHVRTTLELACGRCVERFAFDVDEPFDLLYVPHTENAGTGEVEIEDDDLETAYYRDDQIDLGQLVREQIYLVLPMKPLCSETCQGLCPECGINLNTGSCACRRESTDSRWDALRALANRPKE